MASTPELKISLCVEWTTEKLYGIRPWNSPTFLLQGKQCYFMLYANNPYKRNNSIDYTFFLYICGAHRLTLPLKVKVMVENDTFSLISFPVKIIEDQSDCVWKCSASEFSKRCKIDYALIEYLCFRVMFYEDQSNTSDKCVQTGSYLNADRSIESLSKDFSNLLDSGLNHDAEIKCGEHSVKAHKIVLSARSEVFKAMLQNDMLESKTGVVEIQDMDTCYFQDFIRYLYTDTMPELDFGKAETLYEAGDKYDVKSLVNRCSEYLQDNLSPENACRCLAMADAHSDHKLKEKVVTYILNKQIYLLDEYWSPFCENYAKLANEVYRLTLKSIVENKDL